MSFKVYPENLLSMQEVQENIVKAERYLFFLCEHGFITEPVKKAALDCINETKNRNRVFVTDKFRIPEGLQANMYYLMKSRIRALKVVYCSPATSEEKESCNEN